MFLLGGRKAGITGGNPVELSRNKWTRQKAPEDADGWLGNNDCLMIDDDAVWQFWE